MSKHTKSIIFIVLVIATLFAIVPISWPTIKLVLTIFIFSVASAVAIVGAYLYSVVVIFKLNDYGICEKYALPVSLALTALLVLLNISKPEAFRAASTPIDWGLACSTVVSIVSFLMLVLDEAVLIAKDCKRQREYVKQLNKDLGY